MQEASSGCNTEEWRPVVGYEGAYEVSNQGRLRQAGMRRNRLVSRLLKQNMFRDGIHLYVGLCPDGKGNQNTRKCQRKISVHVLVAEAFLGHRPPGMHINHKDGFGFNNWADNLEYCTPAENAIHARRIGLTSSSVTVEQVRTIRAAPPEVNNCELGRRLGIHHTQVSRIRRRLSWAWLED